MTDAEVERWRPVPGSAKHMVSNLGRIRNAHGAITLGSKTPAGYMTTTVNKKSCLVHRLIAIVWLEPPNDPEKKVVNHINGKKDDNRTTNLEWATSKENANKQVFPGKHDTKSRRVIQKTPDDVVVRIWASQSEAARSLDIRPSDVSKACRSGYVSHGSRWEYYEEVRPPGEEWREIEVNGGVIEVSSLGFVRGRTGYTTPGSTNSYNYRTAEVGGKPIAVHRLVAQAFLPDWDSALIVNHKDGNKGNNVVDNLEMTTAKGNVAHAIATGLRGRGGLKRPVIRTSPTGEEVEFESAAEAARQTGCLKSNIITVCNGRGLSAKGYSWRYADLHPPRAPVEPKVEAVTIPDDDPIWAELGL